MFWQKWSLFANQVTYIYYIYIIIIFWLRELNDKLEVLETSIQLKTNQLYNQNIPATGQDLVELESCRLSQLSSSDVLSLLMQLSVIRIIELEEQIKSKKKLVKFWMFKLQNNKIRLLYHKDYKSVSVRQAMEDSQNTKGP